MASTEPEAAPESGEEAAKDPRILRAVLAIVIAAIIVLSVRLIGWWTLLIVPVALFGLAIAFNVGVSLWKGRRAPDQK